MWTLKGLTFASMGFNISLDFSCKSTPTSKGENGEDKKGSEEKRYVPIGNELGREDMEMASFNGHGSIMRMEISLCRYYSCGFRFLDLGCL